MAFFAFNFSDIWPMDILFGTKEAYIVESTFYKGSLHEQTSRTFKTFSAEMNALKYIAYLPCHEHLLFHF